MGFGKTSTTIALVAARERARLPPIPPIDRGCYYEAPKTTLILVPTQLLNQWKDEVISTDPCRRSMPQVISTDPWLKNSSQEFLDYSVKIHAADIESCIRKLPIPMDIVGTPWVLDK
jgi:SNF2 family DNA or RNA helicase